MPDGPGTATAPPEPVAALQHLDWDRAVANHQSEEQLRAFLREYPEDLRRTICSMREALSSNDYEKLREAGQQVMGSSSYVAALRLHESARSLVEAIDLDEEGVLELANRTAAEAEELTVEISGLFPKEAAAGGGKTKEAPETKKGCCSLQ